MLDKIVPILSVVVPAYNAENTLGRCIDSLLDQDGVPIEIIISNDGSTDQTQSIIDMYVSNNPHIISVYGDNGGPSCARNRGLKRSEGKWITFVDSDDYVAPGIFKKIIQVLTMYEPDMLDYQYWVSSSGMRYETTPNQLPKDTVLGCEWISNTIIPVALNISDKKEFFIENFVWNKVFNADIIRNKNVEFDETRRKWEDRLFSLTFLQYAESYYSMSEYGYYYVCGSNQTLSGRFEPSILRIIMDSYQKYRLMYGTTYCFDNSYTTNYFCDLLITVAKDQFAYNLKPTVLKEMFTIFVDDKIIQHLFASCNLLDKDKQKVAEIIQKGSVEEIYNVVKKYASQIEKQRRKKQGVNQVRAFLSKVKQIIVYGR